MTKIAICITSLGLGGAQEVALMQAKALVQTLKHEVTIVCGYKSKSELELAAIRFRNAGAKVLGVRSLQRSLNPMLDLFAALSLLNIFWNEKFDILHTHTSKATVLAGLTAKICRIKKIIFHEHNPPFNLCDAKLLKLAARIILKYTYRLAHKIVCVSPVVRDQIVTHALVDQKKIEVIVNPIDFDLFRPASKSNRSYRVIGFIGRLEKSKGIFTFLKVAAQILERTNDVHFIIVGEGRLRNAVNKWIHKNHLYQRIKISPAVSRDNIPSILNQIDVLALFSKSEGMPLVVQEAIATGTYVVASDIPPLRMLVKEEQVGVLVDMQNEPLLVDRLLSALSRTPEVARSASSEFLQDWGFNLFVKRLENLYAS